MFCIYTVFFVYIFLQITDEGIRTKYIKGAVMETEKAMMNYRLRVSKVS